MSLRLRLLLSLLALAALGLIVVDAVKQERALLGVGHGAEDQQPGGRQPEHGRDQPRAQRGHHGRGARRTYPTPRTVWINGAPWASSLRRR